LRTHAISDCASDCIVVDQQSCSRLAPSEIANPVWEICIKNQHILNARRAKEDKTWFIVRVARKWDTQRFLVRRLLLIFGTICLAVRCSEAGCRKCFELE
jgi:hypothetical protein